MYQPVSIKHLWIRIYCRQVHKEVCSESIKYQVNFSIKCICSAPRKGCSILSQTFLLLWLDRNIKKICENEKSLLLLWKHQEIAIKKILNQKTGIKKKQCNMKHSEHISSETKWLKCHVALNFQFPSTSNKSKEHKIKHSFAPSAYYL